MPTTYKGNNCNQCSCVRQTKLVTFNGNRHYLWLTLHLWMDTAPFPRCFTNAYCIVVNPSQHYCQ